jgi:hypothetical protein
MTYNKWTKAKFEALRINDKSWSYKEFLSYFTANNWHTECIMPKIEAGQMLDIQECKSIAKHGGGYSLIQLAKMYPGAIPENINIHTGKAL